MVGDSEVDCSDLRGGCHRFIPRDTVRKRSMLTAFPEAACTFLTPCVVCLGFKDRCRPVCRTPHVVIADVFPAA